MQVTKRVKDEGFQKVWMKWVFLALIWLLTISSFKDFLQTKKGFLRIKETEERLEKVKRENEELNNKLSLVSSTEHKEKLVREKLNMQRSDEVVVILPRVNNITIRQENQEKRLKNWEKWLVAVGVEKE